MTVVQTTRQEPPAAVAPTYASFSGAHFSLDYPDAWDIEAAELPKGGYLDTTIRSLTKPDLMIRVDVTPSRGAAIDTSSAADEVERSLAAQPRYRELSFTTSRFQGYESIDWEFIVQEGGILLEKRDIFFTDAYGDGVAILTQAPVGSFSRWRSAFAHVRQSLLVTPLESASPPSSSGPAADFCDSHDCIESFYDGTGYIVQCNDGMWSHSGGRPGACSYHGGESGNVYTGPETDSYNGSGSGSGTDLGPGNGSTVLCADGSISHSGGIQGACSHHGGVSP
ncbi:MAG TPA: hypothetical protein VK488_05400 [Gaiellaceae bacterium]|nr:hypothetical protein [Gaiellaceae bacterium]